MNKKMVSMVMGDSNSFAIISISNLYNDIFGYFQDHNLCTCDLYEFTEGKREFFIDNITSLYNAYSISLEALSALCSYDDTSLSEEKINSIFAIYVNIIIKFLSNEFDNFLIMKCKDDMLSEMRLVLKNLILVSYENYLNIINKEGDS